MVGPAAPDEGVGDIRCGRADVGGDREASLHRREPVEQVVGNVAEQEIRGILPARGRAGARGDGGRRRSAGRSLGGIWRARRRPRQSRRWRRDGRGDRLDGMDDETDTADDEAGLAAALPAERGRRRRRHRRPRAAAAVPRLRPPRGAARRPVPGLLGRVPADRAALLRAARHSLRLRPRGGGAVGGGDRRPAALRALPRRRPFRRGGAASSCTASNTATMSSWRGGWAAGWRGPAPT